MKLYSVNTQQNDLITEEKIIMTQTNINTMDLIVSKMEHGKTLSAAMKDVYTKRNVAIPYREEWLKCELTSLKMSMRTTQALLRNKMQTIGDIVNYTKERKITSLKTFGKISAIELFSSILDYCWGNMSQEERDVFLIDTVERNSSNLRAEIEF
jgi:DNA-directed RNA polymerase alpha subunit